MFQKRKVKGALNTLVIYHNETVEDIKAILEDNKDFIYNGKRVVIVAISDTIKLTDRNESNMFSSADVESLNNWLSKDGFNGGKMRVFLYINPKGVKDFYIKCAKPESTLFMYLILSSFNESVFMKHP